MSGPTPELSFTHYTSDTAGEILNSVIAKLYRDTHADVVSDPSYSTELFLDCVGGYMRSPAFEVVVVSVDNEQVGFALGHALPKDTSWWHGLITEVEPGFTDEDGTRTFGLCELMVHPDWQGRGVARAVHDELLLNRPERRAILFVREDDEAAQRAYATWGWRRAAKLQPYPDLPRYDVLVLDLALYRSTRCA